MLNIEVDNQDTWSFEIKNLLQENFDLIRSYNEEESRFIDLPYPDKYYFRNKYRDKYFYFLDEFTGFAKRYNITGYHCTRLLESEIKDIEANGLSTLSEELIVKKLNFAVTCNAMSSGLSEYLISNNLFRETNRCNLLHFTCAVPPLKEEYGVGKFFRGWGGEVIYNLNENDVTSWKTISNIGKPCIVKVKLLPATTAFSYYNIWESIVDTFFQSHAEEPLNSFSDARMQVGLPADQILEIITIDNPKFLMLTDHKDWDLPLM